MPVREREENDSPNPSPKSSPTKKLGKKMKLFNTVDMEQDEPEPSTYMKTLKTISELLKSVEPKHSSQDNENTKDLQAIRNDLRQLLNKIPTENNSTGEKKKKKSFTPFVPEFPKTDQISFYEITFEGDLKRSVNPFKIHERIHQVITELPKRLFSINRNKIVIEVTPKESTKTVTTIVDIDGVPCKIAPYAPFNTLRGLIYVKYIDFKIENNLIDLSSWLAENYNITNVSLAPFIKPRDNQTTALIVTFNENSLPYSIYIPGEETDTKVYPYINKPMLCANFQNYGHTAARCRSTTAICRKCSLPGHMKQNCDDSAITVKDLMNLVHECAQDS